MTDTEPRTSTFAVPTLPQAVAQLIDSLAFYEIHLNRTYPVTGRQLHRLLLALDKHISEHHDD